MLTRSCDWAGIDKEARRGKKHASRVNTQNKKHLCFRLGWGISGEWRCECGTHLWTSKKCTVVYEHNNAEINTPQSHRAYIKKHEALMEICCYFLTSTEAMWEMALLWQRRLHANARLSKRYEHSFFMACMWEKLESHRAFVINNKCLGLADSTGALCWLEGLKCLFSSRGVQYKCFQKKWQIMFNCLYETVWGVHCPLPLRQPKC